jgi:hypothetical protein
VADCLEPQVFPTKSLAMTHIVKKQYPSFRDRLVLDIRRKTWTANNLVGTDEAFVLVGHISKITAARKAMFAATARLLDFDRGALTPDAA